MFVNFVVSSIHFHCFDVFDHCLFRRFNSCQSLRFLWNFNENPKNSSHIKPNKRIKWKRWLMTMTMVLEVNKTKTNDLLVMHWFSGIFLSPLGMIVRNNHAYLHTRIVKLSIWIIRLSIYYWYYCRYWIDIASRRGGKKVISLLNGNLSLPLCRLLSFFPSFFLHFNHQVPDGWMCWILIAEVTFYWRERNSIGPVVVVCMTQLPMFGVVSVRLSELNAHNFHMEYRAMNVIHACLFDMNTLNLHGWLTVFMCICDQSFS